MTNLALTAQFIKTTTALVNKIVEFRNENSELIEENKRLQQELATLRQVVGKVGKKKREIAETLLTSSLTTLN